MQTKNQSLKCDLMRPFYSSVQVASFSRAPRPSCCGEDCQGQRSPSLGLPHSQFAGSAGSPAGLCRPGRPWPPVLQAAAGEVQKARMCCGLDVLWVGLPTLWLWPPVLQAAAGELQLRYKGEKCGLGCLLAHIKDVWHVSGSLEMKMH
eukprot:1157532-Pelagomonas_calceolata.AAC.6